MKISYRVASIAVVLAVVLQFIVPESMFVRPRIPTGQNAEGTISFDPCFMWEQIAWTIRLATFVWLGTFLPLLVQGLRNRTLPRLVAVVSLIAFFLSLQDQPFRVLHCQSNFGISVFLTWVLAVALLCFQHAVQRPVLVGADLPRPIRGQPS
jgi:uncharacterized membrane protein YhaH (DUF805 family)